MKYINALSVVLMLSPVLGQGRIVYEEEEKQHELDKSIDVVAFKKDLDVYSIVRSVLNYRMGGLQYIYMKHKGSNKEFKGQVMLKLVINKQGTVERIQIMRTQFQSREFHAEIMKEIKEWNFGMLPVDEQKVVVPFYFS